MEPDWQTGGCGRARWGLSLRRLGGKGIPRGKPDRHPVMRFVCRPRARCCRCSINSVADPADSLRRADASISMRVSFECVMCCGGPSARALVLLVLCLSAITPSALKQNCRRSGALPHRNGKFISAFLVALMASALDRIQGSSESHPTVRRAPSCAATPPAHRLAGARSHAGPATPSSLPSSPGRFAPYPSAGADAHMFRLD